MNQYGASRRSNIFPAFILSSSLSYELFEQNYPNGTIGLLKNKQKVVDFLKVDLNKATITLPNKQVHYLLGGEPKTNFWTRLDFFLKSF